MGFSRVIYYCPRGSGGLYCFRRSFFLCMQDNSWTATLSLMKFCRNMYLSSRTNHIDFEGHSSKVKVIFSLVDQSSPKSVFVERGKIVVANAVFLTVSCLIRSRDIRDQNLKFTCFFVFSCVRDAAATRGQYLALSKARRSCCDCECRCQRDCDCECESEREAQRNVNVGINVNIKHPRPAYNPRLPNGRLH